MAITLSAYALTLLSLIGCEINKGMAQSITFVLLATAFVLALTLSIQKIMDKKGENYDS